MINFKQYILQENADATNKHLTHLDELILTKGYAGGEKTIEYISKLLEMLHGHTEQPINVSAKWDGAPAIVCGRDAHGKFFIGTKSVFAVDAKLNYSIKDIRKNHGDAPGLVEKLEYAFDVLRKVNFDGVYQGDLLFWPGLLQSYRIEVEDFIGFRPNTILYTVAVDSPEAKKILSSKIGVVFHTKYAVTTDENGSLKFVGKQFGIRVDHLKSNGAYIRDALFDNRAGTISLTQQESSMVKKTINNMQYVLNSINFSVVDKKMSDMINIFINSQIRRGQFLDDVTTSVDEFKQWVAARYDAEISKLKRKESKTAAKEQFLETLDRYVDSLINLFKFIKEAKAVKDIFIQKYNAIMQGSAIGTYLVYPNGDVKVTNPEGYVAFDAAQNGIKLVDRLEFSRANQIIPKNWIKDENV
jgi:hypothetical protein